MAASLSEINARIVWGEGPSLFPVIWRCVGDSSRPLSDTLHTKFISFMGLKLFQIHIKDLPMPPPCIIYSATARNKSPSISDCLAVSRHGYCPHGKNARSSHIILYLCATPFCGPSLPGSPPKCKELESSSYSLLLLKWMIYRCCCCCSIVQLCLTLCDPMDSSMPGLSVLHYF